MNRLTNIWIPFLILSAECLSEQGRLGMVIPAELFQVDYAAETRKYLAEKFEHIVVITFRKLVFEGTQQEIVILLAEMTSEKKGIEVYELNGAKDLITFVPKENNEIKELNHGSEKWVKYYLSNEELYLMKKMEEYDSVLSTTQLFEVNVGVVSGQNKFFVIDKEVRDEYHLMSSVQPIVGRAEQLKGIQFTSKDFEELENKNKKVFLFSPSDKKYDDLADNDQAYILYGETKDYHKGFKCRNRKRWYIVPQSWQPEAFMLRQINKFPKIVFNNTSATNTDTLHKIRFKKEVNAKAVVAAFLNSFTFAQAEVTGRSYGGGVMSFEPNEVRKLQIPMANAEQLNFEYIDELLRKGEIYSILNYVDEIVLVQGLGLTKDEVLLLRGIWEKLSERRLGRKAER